MGGGHEVLQNCNHLLNPRSYQKDEEALGAFARAHPGVRTRITAHLQTLFNLDLMEARDIVDYLVTEGWRPPEASSSAGLEVRSCRGSDKLTGQPCERQADHDGPCGPLLDDPAGHDSALVCQVCKVSISEAEQELRCPCGNDSWYRPSASSQGPTDG